MQQTSVVAVVVSYRPDERLFRALDALAPQVARIVVVDNGSGVETVDRLRAAARAGADKLSLILNEENAGLAAAQNQGIRQALDEGADWVLLMDDDSIPGPEMVASQLSAHAAHSAADSIGLVAPLIGDAEGTLKARAYVSKHAFDFRPVRFGAGDVLDDVAFAMASGSLIRADVFRDVGLMREDFFVDYIDFEFAFRMRRGGWKLIAVGDARLQHRLGEFEQKTLFGRQFCFNSHSSFRRYHIYRNRMRVWWAHGFRLPAFFAFEAASIGIDLAKLILLEDDKLDKLGAIGRGVMHALLGRSGVKAG
ncbi:glycosyltransferase family 2 protein [Nisaea acidiphila]|uniref:Glycosyltransferase family 2 protein n=1 Tax=Nisaea acidiphila TaxID=1862145 RepID=A0A9J7AKX6_9PROT|nr:glycosyltransferase family 2 protein [Nisaea acidiphila]UUX48307.1 glycosyltransferase family 2 protein [Nisaea acidiphila]